MQKTIRLSALSVVLLTLLGCAAAPAKKDPRDPWERMNRSSFKFTRAVDKAVLRPVARGYQKVTPQFVRTGVSNFMDNLGYPLVMVNDLLQARFKTFARDTGRLLINTTLGIGGLLDPATPAGLEKNENDFGLTAGRWGIPKGPYFFIPFLGPSDVRDGVARIPNAYLSPQNYVNDVWVEYSIWAVSLLDARYRLLPTDPLLDSAYDPYTFMKSAYLQRRDFLLSKIKGGPTTNESDADKLLDEATQEEESEQPPAPAPGEIKPETPKPDQSNPDQPKADQASLAAEVDHRRALLLDLAEAERPRGYLHSWRAAVRSGAGGGDVTERGSEQPNERPWLPCQTPFWRSSSTSLILASAISPSGSFT